MKSPPAGTLPAHELDNELRAPSFSLRQLSYFLAAARLQSVQAAGEAMHVSAPAVSAAISHLEETLGAPLFVRRHARGLVLTEAGSAFAVECRNLLQDAARIGADRELGPREVRGRIHVACLFSFAPYILPPLVRHLSERHPGVRVHWHEGHHEYLLEGLQTGGFDLALTYDFEIPAGIETLPLRPAPLQVVLPSHHRLMRQASVSLQEVATEPLILLDLPRTREYLLSIFSTNGLAPRVAHRVYSLGMLLGLVGEGLGYSLLNFCPPYTHSRPLRDALRTPHIVIARSGRYAASRIAATVTERLTVLVDELPLSHNT